MGSCASVPERASAQAILDLLVSTERLSKTGLALFLCREGTLSRDQVRSIVTTNPNRLDLVTVIPHPMQKLIVHDVRQLEDSRLYIHMNGVIVVRSTATLEVEGTFFIGWIYCGIICLCFA
jgi:hypothetical protein